MFQDLDVFKVSHAMATHAANRQAIVARNIANADTPGYAARDLPSFQEQFSKARATSDTSMRATRQGHLATSAGEQVELRTNGAALGAPNGNSVSLEEEMLKAVDIKRQHDRALTIYKSALGVLRTSLGRR
ncbi:FlgB family protein [Shimia sediminis]|uniref:FlgB family protein n=1 Tax=Shimia sediminis TaxID=2497945 RepID=UPI000F8EFE73|nr:FlgB family protein [Shimia sediminis]